MVKYGNFSSNVMIIFFIIIVGIVLLFVTFTLYNAYTWRTTYPQCMYYMECPEYSGWPKAEIDEFLKSYDCGMIMMRLNITDMKFLGSDECRNIQLEIIKKIKNNP